MRVYAADIVKDEGAEIELYGWVHARRDHGKLVFVDLRDRSGIAQVVFGPDVKSAGDLRLEYVVKILGTVKRRPPNLVNDKIPTGRYEVAAKELHIINLAREMPMPLDEDGYDIKEEVRLKYRYLDLRRERMRNNVLARHKVIKYMRDFLSERGFLEIETPILSKSTPEGARDYLVPSRVFKGKFYALPQSPQQYKQLLMVAGFEKYFQIARCFRDEDTRGDRQPEFTQLDVEMSFATQEAVLGLMEEMFLGLVRALFPEKKLRLEPGERIPRLKHEEAMVKFGTEKPDLRKDKNDPNELAFAFIVDFPMFEKLKDGSLSPVHHPFTLPTLDSSLDPERFQHEYPERQKLLEILYSGSEEEVLGLKAYQYDFVLNGYEIGGGSIRTYDPEVLKMVFRRLGHADQEIDVMFGHLIEAFGYGAPPHGGIAPGIDRFLMILQNEPNIREVIAFPKTGEGYDPLMNSPSEVKKEQLDDLGLEIKKFKK